MSFDVLYNGHGQNPYAIPAPKDDGKNRDQHFDMIRAAGMKNDKALALSLMQMFELPLIQVLSAFATGARTPRTKSRPCSTEL